MDGGEGKDQLGRDCVVQACVPSKLTEAADLANWPSREPNPMKQTNRV
jgi:hypothetical protein